jgi:hypothetical protein
VVLDAGGSLDGRDVGQDRRGCRIESQQSSMRSLDGRLRCPPIVGMCITAKRRSGDQFVIIRRSTNLYGLVIDWIYTTYSQPHPN